MRLQALLSLVPFPMFYGGVSRQKVPDKIINEATDTFIDDLLAGWNSPAGVAIAVVRKDEQGAWAVETKGYGVATLANGARVTENTLFSIASNSKLFAAIATGLLVTNETLPVRLSWTSKLASVIPGWGLQDSTAAQQATILDAMSHHTGLPRHELFFKWSDDVPNVIKKLNFHRPSAEFREVFQYNNNMYTILSYLPTVLLPSKVPFARYVKKNIFEPLGMTSTTYSYDVAKLGHLADGIARQVNYNQDRLGGTPRALPYYSTKGGEDGNVLSGQGGIISNAVDMSIWLQTLLLEGQKPGTNQSVIPAEVIQKVSAGVSVSDPVALFSELSPSVYGGGSFRNAYRGHEVVWHDGGSPGFRSRISRLPSDNLGIAVLCNDNDNGDSLMQIINYRLMDEALGLEKIDWDARFRATSSSLPPAIPRPVNASPPSANFTALAGVYDNAGYGKVEFCFVSSDYPAASSSCKALVANLSTILPGAVNPEIPTFIGAWDSHWASHIKLSHFDGNQFNVSALTSYPTNDASAEPYWTYGGDTAPLAGAYAESIVTGRRFSLAFTGFWGAGDVPRLQGTILDRAEVVFSKI